MTKQALIEKIEAHDANAKKGKVDFSRYSHAQLQSTLTSLNLIGRSSQRAFSTN